MAIDNVIKNYREKSADEKRSFVDVLCDSYEEDGECRCVNCPYENQSEKAI